MGESMKTRWRGRGRATRITLLLLALLLAAPPAQSAPPEDGSGRADPGLTRRCLRILKKSLTGQAGVAAARALGELGNPKGRDHLREVVAKNPRNVYAYASLVWLGEETFIEQALSAMRDPETAVPVATIYGAAFVRRPHEDVKRRLQAIWSDGSQDPVERLWAAASLVEMGDAAATGYVERMLEDRDPYAATVAAGALFARGHAGARKHLVAVLEERRSDLWDQAAISFGEHPDPEILPVLRRTLRRARQAHDRVWLAWAILRTLGYRHGG